MPIGIYSIPVTLTLILKGTSSVIEVIAFATSSWIFKQTWLTLAIELITTATLTSTIPFLISQVTGWCKKKAL